MTSGLYAVFTTNIQGRNLLLHNVSHTQYKTHLTLSHKSLYNNRNLLSLHRYKSNTISCCKNAMARWTGKISSPS